MATNGIIKKSILFVDDEGEILDGLRRMLRDMRGEWKMEFAKSGQEALEIMAKRPFDVIVSDMRMPGMDGAQLLAEVKKSYPNVVRIVLSGHSKQEMIFKSVGTAHQYLAKPCDPEVLKKTVERACSLRAFLADNELIEAVGRLNNLPSLPSLFIEINNELMSPNSSLAKVGDIISKDVGMTAKILQLVNSPFFGFFTEISSPAQAVTLLGLDTIKALVTSVHIFSQIKIKNIGKIEIKKLWNHFFAVGTLSREIAKIEHLDSHTVDKAFMAGILHDVGKIVLISNLPDEYEKVVVIAEKEGVSISEAEHRLFGPSHAEVGGYLLGLWGLPDSIIEAVFFHHQPNISPEREFGITSAVHTANALLAHEMPEYTVGKISEVDLDVLVKVGRSNRFATWQKKCKEIVKRITADEKQSVVSR